MAWAERQPNGNFRACWRDNQGKPHSIRRDPETRKPFTKEAHAKRIAGVQENLARHGLPTSDGRSPTWGDWSVKWLAGRVVEPSTRRQDQVRIDRYLLPYWGQRRLNTITRAQVQEWVNELAKTNAHVPEPKVKPDGWQPKVKPLSPSTVDRILRLFSASMKAAVLDESVPLAASPVVGIKVAPPAPGHERFLTRGEVDAIAHHLNGVHAAAWLILVGTGLRFGELAGLHWQRVDLTERLIHVVETWDSADRTIKAYPKSKKPRSVPIPSWLHPVLGALLDAQHPPKGTCGLRHVGGARCRSGLVVPSRDGVALDGHNFGQREFATAVQLAGLDRVRLHDARHTYASWLVQDGVSLQEVQRLLGHASITTTMRYAALGNTQNAAVLAALEGRGPR